MGIFSAAYIGRIRKRPFGRWAGATKSHRMVQGALYGLGFYRGRYFDGLVYQEGAWEVPTTLRPNAHRLEISELISTPMKAGR